jgi:hypothetical protein
MLMIKTCAYLLFLLNASFAFAGCLSNSQLTQLAQTETNYLIEQIPPAFKHAVQASEVTIAVEPVDGDACQAKLMVTVPQADIDEANAVLDAQPAKKIMLSAQGYGLPESTQHEAVFTVDAHTLKITNADILQTAPLGKLRASLELMYAFITQKRAEVSDTQKNTKPWPDETKQLVVSSCSARQNPSVCTCIAEQYALTIPSEQMEYVQYIRNNPYALATGANQGFEAIKQKAESVCKG